MPAFTTFALLGAGLAGGLLASKIGGKKSEEAPPVQAPAPNPTAAVAATNPPSAPRAESEATAAARAASARTRRRARGGAPLKAPHGAQNAGVAAYSTPRGLIGG